MRYLTKCEGQLFQFLQISPKDVEEEPIRNLFGIC